MSPYQEVILSVLIWFLVGLLLGSVGGFAACSLWQERNALKGKQ